MINDHVQNPAPNLEGRTLYFPYARDVIYALASACRAVGMSAEVLPKQDEETIELGRKHTSGQECFPMIATAGSFLKKLMEPGIDPKKTAFFMPDHNGPCRFGHYNKLQRILFNRLGFNDAEIVQPSNEDAYASIAPGHSTKWRTITYKGIVAIDILRKMQQQKRPYELIKGETNKVYQDCLNSVVESLENGAKNLKVVLKDSAIKFNFQSLHYLKIRYYSSEITFYTKNFDKFSMYNSLKLHSNDSSFKKLQSTAKMSFAVRLTSNN